MPLQGLPWNTTSLLFENRWGNVRWCNAIFLRCPSHYFIFWNLKWYPCFEHIVQSRRNMQFNVHSLSTKPRHTPLKIEVFYQEEWPHIRPTRDVKWPKHTTGTPTLWPVISCSCSSLLLFFRAHALFACIEISFMWKEGRKDARGFCGGVVGDIKQ